LYNFCTGDPNFEECPITFKDNIVPLPKVEYSERPVGEEFEVNLKVGRI